MAVSLRLLPPDAAVFMAAATDGTPDALSQFGIAGAIVGPILAGAAWTYKRALAANEATNAARIAEITAERDWLRERLMQSEVARDAQNRLFQEQAVVIMAASVKVTEKATLVLEGAERERAIQQARAERGAQH